MDTYHKILIVSAWGLDVLFKRAHEAMQRLNVFLDPGVVDSELKAELPTVRDKS